MNETKMTEAWTAFDEAVRWDEKHARFKAQEDGEKKATMARRMADKHLARAEDLEAEAVKG